MVRISGDDQVKALWLDAEFDRTSKAGDTEGTPEYERRKLVRSQSSNCKLPV